jgi:H+/Cl- antiporter ClcA
VLSAAHTAWLPVAAVLGGLVGMLYIFSIDNITSLFRRVPGGQPWRALAAAALMSACIYFGLGWAFRTSPELYTGLAEGDFAHITEVTAFSLERVFPFILILLAKIVLTSVTIGCGMSAGFTGPLIILGMTLGALVSVAAGVEPVSPAYYGFMACGMAALLSATLNIPLAAIALTLTVFGTSYILPAVTGSTLAFFIFKGHAIYHYFGASNESPASGG